MGGQSFRLERIITLATGTILQYKNGSDENLYFYDANNNLQLDAEDKEAEEIVNGNQHQLFHARPLSNLEIQQFGPEARTAFNQARLEREELRRSFAPVKTGQCFVPDTSRKNTFLRINRDFTFVPPLKLNTPKVDDDKHYFEMELQEAKDLDPARCLIHSTVPRKKIGKRSLNPKTIDISTGDLLSLPILRIFDLRNGDAVDVAYRINQGAQRVHLDLEPPSR